MSNPLLSGFNHVATMTRDMDRLIDFYREVFDAAPVFDLVAPGLDLRHVGIDVGNAFVHAWEATESTTGAFPHEMFRRGRLDHLALEARDEEALEILRRRLVARGACEGNITDFGAILSVWFTDPDGMELEVCCVKRGSTMADVADPQPTAVSSQ